MPTGFKLERRQPIPALNLTVEEYTHRSGAKHFHLANDYTENVFAVAFRTVPDDSTGVAHILEHTALCGSERFPVRDPFFLMIRRSLNTFMNAFTTSDYTAYPFASQNRKDYFNLLAVYLDAVFFSRLDPLDFAQEGHRVEFERPDDPDSPLVYKGVVYNEMKGDTSSPISMLYHGVQEALYPTGTYHYNSGGDPAVIPDLTYEGLLEFYSTHYHPSNAVFMTFGDIDAITQQELIASLALDRLPDTSVAPIAVTPEPRYRAPVRREIAYPADEDDLTGRTHVVLGWLLGRNTDLKMLLKCHLLSDVLLDTSASPLRQALEKTRLATAASPLCGFEEDHLEMNFMCGVEGSDPEHADAIEQLILDVLEQVADNGVEVEKLEAVLHQLELSQREIGGDGSPYGLQLIFSCMSAAIHRGDPIALLDLDGALEEIRQEIHDPDFIRRLVRELLLNNPHRVRVVMKPDREMAARLIDEETRRLAARKAAMSDEQKSGVIELARALELRQRQEEDLSLLPKVTREDIPATRELPSLKSRKVGGVTVTASTAGTNGIAYHQVVAPLPSLPLPLADLLPVYTHVVSEIGSAGRDYLTTQHLQHSITGGISAYTAFRSAVDDCDEFSGYLTFSSRTLNPKAVQMAQLVRDTADTPRFDELERLRELVKQFAIRRVNGVASSGHQYAMSAAAASLRPASAVSDRLSGIESVRRLRRLAKDIERDDALVALGESLAMLQSRLRCMHTGLLLIAEPDAIEPLTEHIVALWGDARDDALPPFEAPPIPPRIDRACIVTSQVSYCATAFPTVPETHEDAAALSILAGVLRNNFLHSEIREKGGAYGGGAGHDGTNGVFRFYSYRDPRIGETFDAFRRSVDWVLSTEITDDMLEEAVLGVISSVDAPGSPAGELRQAFHHQLFGRSAEHRQMTRRRFLEVRQADLKRVARDYLTTGGVKGLVTSEQRMAEVDDSFETIKLNEDL